MTAAERKMAAELLRLASSQFGNYGCNDFDLAERIPDKAERDALVREYFAWNGCPEEYYEASEHGDDGRDWRIMDYAMMDFLAHKIEAEAAEHEHLVRLAAEAVERAQEDAPDTAPRERHPRIEGADESAPDLQPDWIGCTCGAGGGIDGHSVFCNLRRGV